MADTNTTTTQSVKIHKGPGRAPQPLDRRLENLEDGKCVDVSKINENGGGAPTIATPTASSTKVTGNSLRIVSNNLESYVRALDMLNLSEEDYQTELEQFKINLASTDGKPRRGRKPGTGPPTPVSQSADPETVPAAKSKVVIPKPQTVKVTKPSVVKTQSDKPVKAAVSATPEDKAAELALIKANASKIKLQRPGSSTTTTTTVVSRVVKPPTPNTLVSEKKVLTLPSSTVKPPTPKIPTV